MKWYTVQFARFRTHIDPLYRHDICETNLAELDAVWISDDEAWLDGGKCTLNKFRDDDVDVYMTDWFVRDGNEFAYIRLCQPKRILCSELTPTT